MAAAIAQRTGIASQLLAAAGARAAELARASNRYGQGALHLAARQGSLPLIRLLLAAGASAAVRPKAAHALDAPCASGHKPSAAAQGAVSADRRSAGCAARKLLLLKCCPASAPAPYTANGGLSGAREECFREPAAVHG
jgi:ankyrin repeat protein